MAGSSSALVAVTASALFVACLAALHVLRPDLPPATHVLSEYSLGPTGWVMALAFLALAVSFAALGIALRHDLTGWLGRFGLLATVLAAVGAAMGGLFPMDPIGTPPDQFSTVGALHQVAFMIGGPAAFLAPLLVNASLAFNAAWRSSLPLLLATVALVWLATVLFGMSMNEMMGLTEGGTKPPTGELPPFGWFNRALVVSWVVWIVALALRSRSLKR